MPRPATDISAGCRGYSRQSTDICGSRWLTADVAAGAAGIRGIDRGQPRRRVLPRTCSRLSAKKRNNVHRCLSGFAPAALPSPATHGLRPDSRSRAYPLVAADHHTPARSGTAATTSAVRYIGGDGLCYGSLRAPWLRGIAAFGHVPSVCCSKRCAPPLHQRTPTRA